MSRIGNKAINLPKGVDITISSEHTITVKGPRGSLFQKVNPDIDFQINNQQISCIRPTNQTRHKALHGLYRSLVQNMIIGVTQGYKKSLELVGLGYKASVENNVIELHTGYSHFIYFALPPEVIARTEVVRGKNPIIHIESNDKQLVGQVAAKIKSLRKPDPYKGKGIRFLGEKIRRKLGKTAGK